MKPAKFTYHTPDSLEAAFQLLGEYGDEAKIIAGGQSLIPVMNLRLAQPEHLIDINTIKGLSQIREEGDNITIGALSRHREIETSALLKERLPLLPEAAMRIGHLAIRNRGTIGGSLSNADPAAEWSLMAFLMDADIEITSARGTRMADITDFIQSVYTSDLSADEILTAVKFPPIAPGEGWAVCRISRRAGDFAIVSVATTICLDTSGAIENLRLCIGGMDVTPVRISHVEHAAVGQMPNEAWIKSAAEVASGIGSPESDMHASAEYRREMAAHLTAEALREALKRCGGGA